MRWLSPVISEVKAGGWETEGHSQLHGEFEVSLTPSWGEGPDTQSGEGEMQIVVFIGLCHPMAVLGFEPMTLSPLLEPCSHL